MNNVIASFIVISGLALGWLLALFGGAEHNRHFNSNTVTHIEIDDYRNAQSISLPIRFELTLKENQTYGVFAMLPSSQVGFSGKGTYTHNHQGMMFMYDTHTPLELDDAKEGLVEQLFVRPGAFDGRMTFVELDNDHAILVGHKVALYLQP